MNINWFEYGAPSDLELSLPNRNVGGNVYAFFSCKKQHSYEVTLNGLRTNRFSWYRMDGIDSLLVDDIQK